MGDTKDPFQTLTERGAVFATRVVGLSRFYLARVGAGVRFGGLYRDDSGKRLETSFVIPHAAIDWLIDELRSFQKQKEQG